MSISLMRNRQKPNPSVSIRDKSFLAENLARIFNLGFTTRKGGHGFGLHSGALAAKELGGALRVQSEGTGLGSTFTLELPLPKTKYYVSTEQHG